MSDVFISYSRRDIEFVRHLFDQLQAHDRQPWADWQDIPPTADWLAEIYRGIEAANTFLFVMAGLGPILPTTCGWLRAASLIRFLGTASTDFDVCQDRISYLLPLHRRDLY